MGKKKKHPEHENLERWLVSYADFITLLFATFTALYALAQSDLSKLKDVSAAVRDGFQEQSIMSGIKSIMQGKSPPSDNPNPIASEKGAGPGVIGKYDSLTYQPGEVKKVEKTYKQLKTDANEINAKLKKEAAQKKQAGAGGGDKGKDGKGSGGEAQGSTDLKGTHAPNLGEEEKNPPKGIDIAIQERGLRVSFDSRLLFKPGTAILKQESEATLDTIAKRLLPYNYTNVIHIEGHTDDQPISSAIYPSNWELSAARASTVVRYLIRKHGFNPKSLVAVGYGDSQPIATNMTPEGRAKNRRVDIIIYSKKVGDETTPSVQHNKEQTLLNESSLPSASSENLLRTEERDQYNRLIEPSKSGPVKVIIENSDGTRYDYNPQMTPSKPTAKRQVVNTKVNTRIQNKANIRFKPTLNKPKADPNKPPVPD